MLLVRNNLKFLDKKSMDVNTGEVKISDEMIILRSIALGSCIAVVVYAKLKKFGGLAHIMLPGRAISLNNEDWMKYAENAIEFLFSNMLSGDVKKKDLEVKLVGGANVLNVFTENDISSKIIKSVLDCLRRTGIKVKAKRLGGTSRRSVFLDIETGKTFYSEGDGAVKIL